VHTNKRACQRSGIDNGHPEHSPPVTYVVAGKCRHIRFFPTEANDADPSGDCRLSTVVDTKVRMPNARLKT
jgi:hypothetical protein